MSQVRWTVLIDGRWIESGSRWSRNKYGTIEQNPDWRKTVRDPARQGAQGPCGRDAMTHAEAVDEAKKRWGADGFVWSTKNYGEPKPYCYVVGSKQFDEPLGTSGECWEAAFEDADLCRDEGCPHFGTKHICRRTNQ